MTKPVVVVFMVLALVVNARFILAETPAGRLQKYASAVDELGGSNGQWDLSWAPRASLIPDATRYAFVQLSTTSLQSPAELEMFEVKNDLISDGYRNLVYYDWKSGQMWVQQYGGFAGTIHFYGPIKVSADGKPLKPANFEHGGQK